MEKSLNFLEDLKHFNFKDIPCSRKLIRMYERGLITLEEAIMLIFQNYREDWPNRKLRDYYIQNIPGDNLGYSIDSNATFYGLFECLDQRRDVYDYIGVADSVIRENLFDKLADVMNVEYEYIYDQWLMCD